MKRLARNLILVLVCGFASGCTIPVPVAINFASITADSYSVITDGRTTTDRLVAALNKTDTSDDGTGIARQVAETTDSQKTSGNFLKTYAKRVSDCTDPVTRHKPHCTNMDRIRGAGTGNKQSNKPRDFETTRILVNGVSFRVPVKSYAARRWQHVVRQQHDISCGAAVLATLLTYHYDLETPEKVIFQQMLEKGEKKKIKKFGFSLLDMKLYLKSRGLRAEGFRASLDKLSNVGIPAIVLLNFKGYRHFVLVKGLQDGKVLVGDPAFGLKIYDRKTFKSLLVNDIVFVLLDQGERGKAGFNQQVEWAHSGKAPIEMARNMNRLESIFQMTLPSPNEF